MDQLFMAVKVLFMVVFALSVVLYDKQIDTARGPMPVWTIAAVQTPLIVLYTLLG